VGRALTQTGTDEFIAGVFKDEAGERRYKLFRPSPEKMPAAGQRTLVVVLHGCTQDADDIARGTRFNEAAARDGFIVLYPEQPESAHPRKCWNWYEPAQSHRGAGEAAIIAHLTLKFAREEGIDERRVFLAGISAGAAMAANLAAGYPEIYAAVAFHSGLPAFVANDVPSALAMMSKGPADSDELGGPVVHEMGSRARVVPVIAIHGVNDPSVSVVNLKAIARQWAVANALAAGVNTPEPIEVHPADHRLSALRYVLSNGTVLAETWRVEGLAHAWSGGSAAGTYTDPNAPDATAMMLEFFGSHPRPR
jgi:poly(hydroxyalkanoate) depolymerase family esterase